MASQKWRRWIGALEALSIALAGALSLLFYAKLPSTLPSEEDYRAAIAATGASKARSAPGDALLLSPHWAERARLFAGTLPVINVTRAPLREQIRELPRLFLLTLPELPRAGTTEMVEALRRAHFEQQGETERFGALSLSLFVNREQERPLERASALLSQAEVYIAKADGGHEPYTRTAPARFSSSRAGWLTVEANTYEIDQDPFHCVYAHPVGAEPLVLEFPRFPLGRTFKVTAGLIGQMALRSEGFGPLDFTVSIDGGPSERLTLLPRDPGARFFTLETTSLAGKSARVRFEVVAPNPHWRIFCFEAEALP